MIKCIKGSLFETEKYGLDALVVFIPCGLTSIRISCNRFVKQFGEPIKHDENYILHQNNTEDKVIETLKYVLIDTNESHRIYNHVDIFRMVAYSLSELSKLGVQHIGMNGIRTDDAGQEIMMVRIVQKWLRQNEHDFKTIHFIDLRGGFNKM